MTDDVLRLIIPGPPIGAQRSGRNGDRYYRPAKTDAVRDVVRMLWLRAGRPRLEGPLAVYLRAYVARPATHYLPAGGLSREGLSNPYPMGKPDGDNIAKAYTDPLQDERRPRAGAPAGARFAFRDDAQVVEWHVAKLWAGRASTEGPRVELTLVPMHLNDYDAELTPDPLEG